MKYKLNDIIPFEQTQEATDYVNSVDGNYYLEDYGLDKNGNMQLIVRQVVFIKPALSEVRTAALARIDSATSAAILAGFEYEVETGEGKEVLHFSYLTDDQQNFTDTANGAILAMQGVEGLPTAVKWNGWRNHTTEYKGDLVRLVLDVSSFLNLYTGGALVHKATQMEIGGQRKAAIEAAETVEEIEALMESWCIS